MFAIIMITLVAIFANGADGQELDSESLKEFTKHFRQFLLEKVANELNITVNITKDLKVLIDECKPKMETITSECKACTRSACQESPTIEDYLKLANPYLYLKEPLDTIGDKISDAVSLIGDGASGFYNSLSGLGSSLESLPGGAVELFSKLNSELGKFDDYFKELGNIIIDTGSLIGDFFEDLFKKKRRRRSSPELRLRDLIDPETLLRAIIERKLSQRAEISPKVRACMQQCSSCTPLLLPTQREIIAEVCGEEVITKNDTIQANLKKIETVYNYTLDTEHPIVQKVVLNLGSLNIATYSLSDVMITTYLDEAYTTYQTDVAYPLLNMALGARAMGFEYWNKTIITV